MAKTKISEWSTTPASNTDIDGINIAEGCAPSGINDAIRDLMAQVRSWQSGASGDPFNGPMNGTIGATTAYAGAFTTLTTSSTVTLNAGTANGVTYLNGSKVLTSGSALTFDGTNLGVGGSTSFGTTYNVVQSGGASTSGYFLAKDSAGVIGQFAAEGVVVIGSRTNHDVKFTQNGTEGMRLTSTGLGIGTSSPATKLDIGANDSTAKTITLRYSSVPSYYSSTYDGSVGLNTLSLNSYNTSSGSSSWSAFSNTSYGSAAIQLAAGTGVANSIRFLVSTAQNTAPTEFMRLDSAGNLGLGVTPSGSWGTQAFMLAKSGASNPTYPFIASTDSQAVFIGSNSYWDGTNWKAQFGGAGVVAMHQKFNYNAISWHTAPAVSTGNTQTFTTAMTLDSSGNLLVGTTSASAGNTFGTGVLARSTSKPLAAVCDASSGSASVGIGRTNSTGNYVEFYYGTALTSSTGTISTNGTTTAYNTTSDYRLKENVAPMTGALDTVSQLKPVTYTWKANGASSQGFIAHELQSVVPDCVTGEKDAVDEDGNPKYQGIDTSFLVATLTAALQELNAKFDAYVASHP